MSLLNRYWTRWFRAVHREHNTGGSDFAGQTLGIQMRRWAVVIDRQHRRRQDDARPVERCRCSLLPERERRLVAGLPTVRIQLLATARAAYRF